MSYLIELLPSLRQKLKGFTDDGLPMRQPLRLGEVPARERLLASERSERSRMDEGGGNAEAILVPMPSLVAALVQKDELADHKANADHMIGLLLCQGKK